MLGKPVYTDAFLASVTNGAKPVVYGDWSKVFVRFAGPIRWEQTTDFAFDRDVVSFRGLHRIDSVVVDTSGALRHLSVTTQRTQGLASLLVVSTAYASGPAQAARDSLR